MFFKGVNDVSSGETNYTAAVTETFNGEDSDDGTNILILGSDQRVTQGSSDARTDTIMVMNIGNSDGKIKLVSFMRDTLVNIDGVSYNDYSNDQKLNVAFNIGEQDNNQGAELMRQTLKDNFDINIKYYVMVDFATFAEAIDTLFPNGVEIDAKFGTVDGQAVSSVEVPDDLNMQADGTVPNQTIEVRTQKWMVGLCSIMLVSVKMMTVIMDVLNASNKLFLPLSTRLKIQQNFLQVQLQLVKSML